MTEMQYRRAAESVRKEVSSTKSVAKMYRNTIALADMADKLDVEIETLLKLAEELDKAANAAREEQSDED